MKKKLEFAQRMALIIIFFSMGIVFLALAGNFVLLWFGKEPMPQETIATISTFGGITATASSVCYSGLTLGRSMSKNKHSDKLIMEEQHEN